MTQPGQGSSGSSSRLPPPKVSDADATDPSLALADVWELLDALPAAEPSIDMMASTLEMAAVPAGNAVAATGGTTSRTGSGTVTGNGATIIRGVKQPPARASDVGELVESPRKLVAFVARRSRRRVEDFGRRGWGAVAKDAVDSARPCTREASGRGPGFARTGPGPAARFPQGAPITRRIS